MVLEALIISSHGKPGLNVDNAAYTPEDVDSSLSQDSCLAGCLRRLFRPWRRLEGEVLPSDPPDFSLAMYWLAHPSHWPTRLSLKLFLCSAASALQEHGLPCLNLRRVAENLPKTIYTLQPDGTFHCEATDAFSNLVLMEVWHVVWRVWFGASSHAGSTKATASRRWTHLLTFSTSTARWRVLAIGPPSIDMTRSAAPRSLSH